MDSGSQRNANDFELLPKGSRKLWERPLSSGPLDLDNGCDVRDDMNSSSMTDGDLGARGRYVGDAPGGCPILSSLGVNAMLCHVTGFVRVLNLGAVLAKFAPPVDDHSVLPRRVTQSFVEPQRATVRLFDGETDLGCAETSGDVIRRPKQGGSETMSCRPGL